MSLPQAAPNRLQQKLYLTIQSGSDKGVAYEVVSQKIFIGRDPENDICLDDPKASRRHAVIEQTPNGLMIKDLGSQNGILYAGQAQRQVNLKHGDLFTVGNTEFSVDFKTQEFMLSNTRLKDISQNDSKPKGSNGRLRFYSIVAIIGICVAALFSTNSSKNKIESDIRNESAVQTEIEAIQKRKELLNREKNISGESSQQFTEAQSSYIKGFRDYREGNYGRAIQSFTAALAIYPSHVLAQKYKKLAERRLDEVVQYTMFQGRRYMEQTKYEMAQSSYKSILVMLNDPANKTYQEAQERLNEINLLLRGKY